MWSDRTKITLEENIFINQQLPCYCSLYVKLATVQIWGQLNKFPLSYNSLKCLLQAKKIIRENSAKKNVVSQTNSTHKRLQLGSQISEPISAGTVNYRLQVKFTRESPKVPCVSRCAQSAEGGEVFLCLGFSLSWSL